MARFNVEKYGSVGCSGWRQSDIPRKHCKDGEYVLKKLSVVERRHSKMAIVRPFRTRGRYFKAVSLDENLLSVYSGRAYFLEPALKPIEICSPDCRFFSSARMNII